MVENINGEKFKELLRNEWNNLEIIDVRDPNEHEMIKIKNSKSIPMSEIKGRIDEIDWNKKVVFVCRSGARSGYVAEALASLGKKSINLEGGIYELNLNDCDCLEKSSECCGGYF